MIYNQLDRQAQRREAAVYVIMQIRMQIIIASAASSTATTTTKCA